MIAVFATTTAFTPGVESNGIEQQAFEDGEWFKFRIHYGVFNAS